MKINTYLALIIAIALILSPSALQAQNDSTTPLPDKLSTVTIAQSTTSNPDNDLKTKIISLAHRDHTALLKLAIKNYTATITDYTGKFHKQERIGKKLGKKQVISFKFREKPFSVAMKWDKNAGSANRLLYIEGQNDNKMLVHPTGLLSLIKSVKLDPRGKQALSCNLRPCDMFGFHRNMLETLKIYEKAAKNGDLTTKCSAIETIDGRDYITLERILPEKKDYPAAKLLVKFDLDYLLPTSLASYDWQGNLISEYTFTDLKFNTGLTDKDFAQKENKL